MRNGGDDSGAEPSAAAPPAPALDYRRLLDLAADPIAVHEGSTLIYANAAAAALVGAPDAAALVGRSLLEFVAPELRTRVVERARALAAAGGTMQATEEVFVRLDGSRVEVETSGVALGDGRTLVVVRDISGRRKAEAAQRAAELRLRAFFQMSGEAIGLSCQGRHVAVNAAHARLFGYSHPDELTGLPVVNLIAPSERARVAAISARRAQGEPLLEPYLTKGLRRDGTEFELEIRATGFQEGGEPWTAAVLRDVTEQRSAERRLQASERRFRELFDLVPVSLWEVDVSSVRAAIDRLRAEGVTDLRAHAATHPELGVELLSTTRIVNVNATGCDMIGARSLEEILANQRNVFLPESIPSYLELVLGLAEGRRTVHFEAWSGTLDGGRKWIESTASLVPGSEHTWERVLFANSDATERRKAEEARRGAELQLRTFFEMSGDAIGLARNGLYVFVNRALATLFGYREPSQLIGQPVSAVVAPSERERVAGLMRQRVQGAGAPTQYETLGLRADGSEFALEVRASRCEVEGGALAMAILRDITEQSEAQRRLLESERRFRQLFTEKERAESRLGAIFDAAAEAMAFTVGGRFERVNGAFVRMFGFARPEEAIGGSVGDLVTPAELARLQERHRRRLAGEPPPDVYRTRGVRRDGTEFDVEVKTAGLKEGDSVATISVLRDVTEERAAERRLTEGLERYRELFEFVPVSLWEVDGTGIHAALEKLRAAGVTDLRAYQEAHPEQTAEFMKLFSVVAVNAFGRAMAGAGSMEELLANLDKVHTPDTFPRYRELGLQLLEGLPIAHAEGWTGTLSGERRWVDAKATVIPGHEADWGRLLFASVDLTERRRAEEERTALQERLRQAEKLEAVGRLAGGVAHDFNNILSGILGYAELTAIELDPASDLHDHQQRIREAALRARDLVRQILAFGRRDRAARRIVDVPAVVREALALMKAGVPSSATLEVRIDPEAGAALIDPTQLHQIVLNLCANARDAIGTYGHIEVVVDPVTQRREEPGLKPGRWVRLRVSDDGVGMDASTRARLFEPFMTTKGPSAGHGLGLAVVHGIVTGAAGAILVESEPGKGSTFDVYLPRREYEEVVVPAAPVRARGKGERILLVDDEPMVLGAHRRLLESLGYTVEIAPDGEQALAMFRASPDGFDLILTDQTMPRLAGMDLAREILAIRPGARIVLCTGYSDRVDDQSASRLGLRAVLAKPIDREALAAAMERALAR